MGPLSVNISVGATNPYVNHQLGLVGQITGRVARLTWDFADGTTTTNVGCITSHTWTNPGVYNVVLTAYNTDNPGGVSGNVQLNVIPIAQPLLIAGSWATNDFQFQFTAQSNLVYTVERATNLAPPIAWQFVQFGYTTNDGMIQFTDSAATNSAQFYRVRTH